MVSQPGWRITFEIFVNDKISLAALTDFGELFNRALIRPGVAAVTSLGVVAAVQLVIEDILEGILKRQSCSSAASHCQNQRDNLALCNSHRDELYATR